MNGSGSKEGGFAMRGLIVLCVLLLVVGVLFLIRNTGPERRMMEKKIPQETTSIGVINGISVKYVKHEPPFDLKTASATKPAKPVSALSLVYELTVAQKNVDWPRFRSLLTGVEGECKRLGISEGEYRKEMESAWQELKSHEVLADVITHSIDHEGQELLVQETTYLYEGAPRKMRFVIQVKKVGEDYFMNSMSGRSDPVISAITTPSREKIFDD